MVKFKELFNPESFKNNKVKSLEDLQGMVEMMVKQCEMNSIDISTVPVLVNDDTSCSDYLFSSMSMGIGKHYAVSLRFYGNDKNLIDYYEEEDKQPKNGGEYWRSRGAVDWDASGFVVSKAAGERLLEMTKKVLGKEECKSWLDWREHEPNWIQFKFSAEEFDVKKLDKLTEDGIVTEERLIECKL